MSDDRTQQIDIELSKGDIATAWRLVGATDVVEVLKEIPTSQRPAGFGYALALAECEQQKRVASHQGRVLRAAARQGVDLATYNIYTSGQDGMRVYAAPMDLAERAEA